MPVDLEIFHDPNELACGSVAADHCRLRFRSDPVLFDLIVQIPTHPAPEGYLVGRGDGEGGYGEYPCEDGHGEPMRYTLAGDWGRLRPRPSYGSLNNAILHFVCELDPLERVWLYWC